MIYSAFSLFLRDDEGATSVEYAVMLMMIVAACITAIQFLGIQVLGSFNDTGAAIDDVLTKN